MTDSAKVRVHCIAIGPIGCGGGQDHRQQPNRRWCHADDNAWRNKQTNDIARIKALAAKDRKSTAVALAAAKKLYAQAQRETAGLLKTNFTAAKAEYDKACNADATATGCVELKAAVDTCMQVTDADAMVAASDTAVKDAVCLSDGKHATPSFTSNCVVWRPVSAAIPCSNVLRIKNQHTKSSLQ